MKLATLLLITWTASSRCLQDVRLPPTITEQTLEKTLLFKASGPTITLPCVATGTPQPEYVWFRNGKPLNTSAGESASRDHSETGTLTLAIVAPHQLVEGSYQCRAENAHGAALSRAVRLRQAGLAGFAHSGIRQYTARQGDQLRLACNAPTSVPDSIYTWGTVTEENDRKMDHINTDKRVNIDDKGNLYFAHVLSTDAQSGRIYICNAYNPFMRETKHGSLSVITVQPAANAPDMEPKIMYSTSSPTVALTGKNLQLKCFFSAKPSDGLQVSWSKVGGDLPTNRYELDLSHATLTIRDVREEDEATYECRGTNSQGSEAQRIIVIVDSVPAFVGGSSQPLPTNVTGGTTASFRCDVTAKPLAEIQWLANGEPLNIGSMGPRFSLSSDGRNLMIRDVCKDCPSGGSDLAVYSCNASNTHGYAFASGYLNVLLPTVMTVFPEPATLEPNNSAPVKFKCGAEADDSTPVEIYWLRDGEVIQYQPGRIQKEPDNSLYIITENEDDGGASFAGNYSCRASNGYSTVVSEPVPLTIQSQLPRRKVFSLVDVWWIFLVVAIIILLLLLLLCCCLCMRTNKGDTYLVDKKERAHGYDPEKELADSGFQDYQSSVGGPVKGSRASISSIVKVDSDDEGSLAEYENIDTGKFDEDGNIKVDIIHDHGDINSSKLSADADIETKKPSAQCDIETGKFN